MPCWGEIARTVLSIFLSPVIYLIFFILVATAQATNDGNNGVHDRRSNLRSSSRYSNTRFTNQAFNRSLAHQLLPNITSETGGRLRLDNVVIVLSSTGGEHYNLRHRIIPAARTWMTLLSRVFVVMEESFTIRMMLRHCSMTTVGNYSTFSCPGEPVYILTRRCSGAYYVPEGVCCKFDEAVNFIFNSHPALFASVKYFISCDDDVYWHVDELFRWLIEIERAGVSHIPLVGNTANTKSPREIVTQNLVYGMKSGCYEINHNEWYHPIFLNRAAIEVIRHSTREYAATQTCRAFGLSQDAGLGILMWMYGLHHVAMPSGILVHPAKGACIDSEKRWFKDKLYRQEAVVGCGDLTGPSGPWRITEKTGPSMYDAWKSSRSKARSNMLQHFVNTSEAISGRNYDENMRTNNITARYVEAIRFRVKVKGGKPPDGLFVESLFGASSEPPTAPGPFRMVPVIMPLLGYELTAHSKLFNITDKFVAFGPEDCIDPGIDHKDKPMKNNGRLASFD